MWRTQHEIKCLTAFHIFQVLTKFQEGEKIKKPSIDMMFTDVYAEMPAHIQEQREQLREHLKEYGKHYPIEQFE